MNNIVALDEQKLIDAWLEQEQNGIEFPVDFEYAWRIAGYSTKGNCKRKLSKKIEGKLFIRSDKKSTGRPIQEIMLSCDGLKHLCLMAATDKGDACREYFIEAEKKWRMVQQKAPKLAEEIELAKLQRDAAIASLRSRELDHTMLTLHGAATVLALRGKEDLLVPVERETIEVIDQRNNTRYSGQTLTQVKKYLNNVYGFNIKSGAEVERLLEEIGELGAIGAIPRTVSSKYIPQENLDNAIAKLVVHLNKSRQLLLGENVRLDH